MKNFFSSPPKSTSDLENFSQLDHIQRQLRELRDDHAQMNKDLRTIVKAVALLVSAPEPEEIEI